METNDLRMVEENSQFDIQASGILWNEETDAILLSRENNEQGIQVLPGGAVKRFETSQQAVVREMLEETGYETKIVRLLALIESTFSIEENTDKTYQQINFVYLLKRVAHSDRHKIVASEEKVRPIQKHRQEVKNVKPTILNEIIAEFPTSVRFEVSFD